MKGGTKPRRSTKSAENGAKKSGGVNTTHHAGPKRASKSAPTGGKARNSKLATIHEDVFYVSLLTGISGRTRLPTQSRINENR